jgi:YVTN family beta-propeller protein
MGAMAQPALAQRVTSTVPTGSYPGAVAANPLTNKIYVANLNQNTVTVIDGATNNTTTVPTGAGSSPAAVAVNPVAVADLDPGTKKSYVFVYVADLGSSSVTVIDGSTDTAVTSVAVGAGPVALAVNPVTNIIYAANQTAGTVSVINVTVNKGVPTATVVATVPVGKTPSAIAVNPVTNAIYVANQTGNSVTVINGATNTPSATVAVGSTPAAIAVNPVTNTVYVANQDSTVTVINGATNATTAVPTGALSRAIAVNPATDTIYVANQNAGTVTVINGASNTFSATVTVAPQPVALAIDPVTNQIYVAGFSFTNGMLTVIAGGTNVASNLPVGSDPFDLAINPVTNKIYVGNVGSGNVTVIDGATNGTATALAESFPSAVGVNPATNFFYVTDESANAVTAINGATNAVTNIPVGGSPDAVAVNSLTDNIYVANQNANTVTVISGASNTASATVPVGAKPVALAENLLTNKIYVANASSNTVTIIDGATNGTTTLSAGTEPSAVAVNVVTDKIYVANELQNTLTIIDGATNNTTPVGTGQSPRAIAVNSFSNKIYVANYGGASITVVDGLTDHTSNIPVGNQPIALAVDEASNKIYVANQGSDTVSVIDGATNQVTATIPVGTQPMGAPPTAIAFNGVTNKIYVTNSDGTVTVIDGSTSSTSTLAVGSFSGAVVVNRATNEIAVANGNSSNVTLITEQNVQTIPLTTAITPLPGNQIVGAGAVPFTFTTSSSYAPNAPPVENVYYRTDTWRGPWLAATPAGANTFTGQTGALAVGPHFLFAFAGDAQMAPANGLSSPVIGNIAVYYFAVIPVQTSTLLTSSVNPSPAGSSVTFTATVTTTGTQTPTGTVTFVDGSTTIGSSTVTSTGATTATATLAISNLAPGAHSVTAVYSGDQNGGASVSNGLTETVQAQNTTTLLGASPNPAFLGGPVTFTATVSGAVSGTPTGTVNFLNGGAMLGSGTLNASGVATYSNSSLALGTYNITATYLGDPLNTTSTSTSLSVTVGAASFVLSATPSLVTVTAGSTASYIVSIAPEGNFTGSITLCMVPAGATTPACSTSTPTNNCNSALDPADTCTFGALSANPPGTNTVTSTLSIVTSATARLGPPPSLERPAYHPLYVFGAFLAALSIFMLFAVQKLDQGRRRLYARYAALAMLIVTLGLTVSSCHNNSTTAAPPAPQTGSFAFIIVGTSGSTTSTTQVTITVNAP